MFSGTHTVVVLAVLVVMAAVVVGLRCCGLVVITDEWREEEKEAEERGRTGLMSESGELWQEEIMVDYISTASGTHLVSGFLVE